MSSPAAFQGTSHWQPSIAQPSPQMDDGEEAGVTVRPMRLKVLYTFDDQNKTNCLARWPQILQVRTVVIDEGACIGVIELKTCIQAIVQCSPELVAKLGQDYTVYAYDYSEYDNPLVGQGMLSWALAAASPTPNAPAHQSQQLITGRVCKNIQGLFSNGVAETLEVKLRLVPVPTVLQSEYLANMERYRELSRPTAAGSSANEWQTLIQSNPNLAQMANNAHTPTPNISAQRDGVSMEVVNQLLSPQVQQEDSTDPFNHAVGYDFGAKIAPESAPGSASDRTSTQKNSRPSSRASVKRPRKPRAKSAANGGNTSGYEEGTDGDDGPAPKKRAKITRTDWNIKLGFGTASDSLRVAASTAGSLRAFRPIAMMQPGMGQPGTGANMGSHLQDIPRAPTPVPGGQPQLPALDYGRSQSALRRDSSVSQIVDVQPQQYQSPYRAESEAYTQDLIQPSIESAMTSPEKYDSAADTPADICSSPPVLRTATSARSSPQIPSSPVLPQMPRTDSGFMSGDVNELFEEEDGTRPMVDDEGTAVAEYNHMVNNNPFNQQPPVHWQEVNPGPPELLPTKILPRNPLLARPKPESKPKPKVVRPRLSRARAGSSMSDGSQARPTTKSQDETTSQQNALIELPSALNVLPLSVEASQFSIDIQPHLSAGSHVQQTNNELAIQLPPAAASAVSVARPANRPMSRTASVGSLSFPTVAASDPGLPPTGLHRSQTWSEAPYPATDAPTPREYVRGTTAGTIAKKNAQKARLEEAISKGEMPPYCNNCGAIETPTWRKGFAQDHKGDPGYHEYSDAPGRVTAIEILDRDGEGKPISYRIFKKNLLQDEERAAFAEILLCNPCGIWMSKYKTMRPEDKWNDSNPPPAEKRLAERKPRDRSKSKKGLNAPTSYATDLTSEAYFQSDVFGTVDYGPPQETPDISQPQVPPAVTQEELQLPPQLRRASSARPRNKKKSMTSEAASSALKRAIQSSPARWLGTQHSPIELEESMGSTRRLLFPSPPKDQGSVTLCDTMINVIQPAMGLWSPMARRKNHVIAAGDKENYPPLPLFEGADDDIIKLFEEEMERPSRPSTPVQKSLLTNVFKTPTRPTPNHRPITRSVSKSAKSVRMHLMPRRTPTRTPQSSAVRRSPRNHLPVLESPFTTTMNRLMSDVHEHEAGNIGNESLAQLFDPETDFSNLPDLGHSGANGLDSDALNFHFPYDNHPDFFSTDLPMPSSPPRLFNVFEDPLTSSVDVIDNMDHMWSDFPIDDSTLQAMGGRLTVDANGHASYHSRLDPSIKVKVENLAVDHENALKASRHVNETQNN